MEPSTPPSPEDRLGMTEEQWAIFQRLTSGYGDQDENGIDLSLLRENLKLTPEQRLAKLEVYANELISMRTSHTEIGNRLLTTIEV